MIVDTKSKCSVTSSQNSGGPEKNRHGMLSHDHGVTEPFLSMTAEGIRSAPKREKKKTGGWKRIIVPTFPQETGPERDGRPFAGSLAPLSVRPKKRGRGCMYILGKRAVRKNRDRAKSKSITTPSSRSPPVTTRKEKETDGLSRSGMLTKLKMGMG